MSSGDPTNYSTWATLPTASTTPISTVGYVDPNTYGTQQQKQAEISVGSGGQLYSNGLLIGFQDKPSINNLSNILKDTLTRKIILCKDKEECKQKFGEYGLELYESLLAEILELGIKSEESFNDLLKQEQDKVRGLKDYILNNFQGNEKEKQVLSINLYIMTM